MKTSLILFTLFLFLCSVSAQNLPSISYYPESVSKLNANIQEKCKLDLYLPEKSAGFPAIIWFHGGGLSGGEREIPAELKGKGIAVIGVGYRLTPQAKSPDYIEDAAAAVAWVFKNITKYGGDSSLIFVSGHSAGGYLAAMVGLDKSWLAAHQIDANRLAGIIPFSGQMITHFSIRKERGIPDTQPVIDKFAPLFHVRSDAPPLLLITGDREMELLGRYEENAYMMRMMKVAGHKQTTLFELQGYDHGMTKPGFPLLLDYVKKVAAGNKK
ncbi:MAG: alpha/beta hydrolase [Bacteroidetes bacterium]|nr:alpha/beta hydrolase [Bacteroidota bacterium]